jgi:hypothetical protein
LQAAKNNIRAEYSVGPSNEVSSRMMYAELLRTGQERVPSTECTYEVQKEWFIKLEVCSVMKVHQPRYQNATGIVSGNRHAPSTRNQQAISQDRSSCNTAKCSRCAPSYLCKQM